MRNYLTGKERLLVAALAFILPKPVGGIKKPPEN